MTGIDRTARKMRLSLLLLQLAALLALPLTATAASVSSNGERLYLLHCAGCHGINGKSVIPDTKDFSRIELMTQPDQNLLDLIRSGRNMMPPYLGILNDQDIISIVNHIRTLN